MFIEYLLVVAPDSFIHLSDHYDQSRIKIHCLLVIVN